MELLVGLSCQIAGEHPDWDEFRRTMVTEQRCVIAVSIERAGPDRRG